jgi:hypothetical protein
MKTVVILQPQFFPWRGVFEQIRLADEFVYLDDVQFQKGGFVNRVQIKTADGSQWLTVPVLRNGSLPLIRDVEIDYRTNWREKHVKSLQLNYARTPFLADALRIISDIYAERPRTIAHLCVSGTQRCNEYLGLRTQVTFSSWTPVPSMQSMRLVELLVPRGASTYVTGRGALDYLDEPLLASNGIDVRVMEYRRTPYPQLHGAFDPHVTILDTIANLGPEAAGALDSPALPWSDVAPAVA